MLVTVESEVGGKGQNLTLEMGGGGGRREVTWERPGLMKALAGILSRSCGVGSDRLITKPLGREDGIWEEALARGRNGRRMGCE